MIGTPVVFCHRGMWWWAFTDEHGSLSPPAHGPFATRAEAIADMLE